MKVVNGVIVRPGEAPKGGAAGGDVESGGAAATVSNAFSGERSQRAKSLFTDNVTLCGKSMPMYYAVGGASLLAFLFKGVGGLFFVAIACVVYTFVKVFGNPQGASGGGGGGSSGGGGGGGGRGRPNGGPRIKGIGDLPKPPPRS